VTLSTVETEVNALSSCVAGHLAEIGVK